MSKIPLEKFNMLWDEIRDREHKTDFGLAKAIGLSNGTVSQWRAGKVKAVLPNVISMIEKSLGYKIRRDDSGDWIVKKDGEIDTVQTRQDLSGRLTETDGGGWGEIREYLERHELDSLDKVKRRLQRCDELEGLVLLFEDRAREIKLRSGGGMRLQRENDV